MGNCQASTEAATVLIQRPGGGVERLYWPTSASEVMKNHPGHHVAVITLYVPEERRGAGGGGGAVRLTRVRLLKPGDTLLLGHVYRLVSSQEVMRAIQARKNEKMKKREAELVDRQRIRSEEQSRLQLFDDGSEQDSESTSQVVKPEREAKKGSRTRQWRPSLERIEETGI